MNATLFPRFQPNPFIFFQVIIIRIYSFDSKSVKIFKR